MVSGENNKSILYKTFFFQKIEQFPQFRIDISHLSWIRVIFILAPEGFGRGIHRMRIPEMNPGKPFGILPLQPSECGLNHFLCASFSQSEFGRQIRRIRFIINLKSLGETEARIKRKSSDECSGGIFSLLQVLGQSEKLVIHSKLRVVMHSMCERSGSQ